MYTCALSFELRHSHWFTFKIGLVPKLTQYADGGGQKSSYQFRVGKSMHTTEVFGGLVWHALTLALTQASSH
jgi:hypothetical protein